MDILVTIPKVIQGYVSRFPEVQRNAYPYFNYDNRVVDERVERFDGRAPYKGPDDFSDFQYEALLVYANSLLNPILMKYSPRVACEDALSQAIRSFGNGIFDNKVNANRYNVLLQAMMSQRFASKKKEKSETVVKPHVLKQLGVTRKEIPKKERIRERLQKGPSLYKSKGKIMLRKSDNENEGGSEMIKNAKEYAERLDKIAEEIQKVSPEIALQIDMVSDVIEGRKDASTLKFDPDEARYMANRFNYDVRSREADEPYMDNYNKSDFEQVMGEKENPKPVVKPANFPYQKA